MMANLDPNSINYQTDNAIQELIRAKLDHELKLPGAQVAFKGGRYELLAYQSPDGSYLPSRAEAQAALERIVELAPELMTPDVVTNIERCGRGTEYWAGTLTMPPIRFRELIARLGFMDEYERIVAENETKLAEARKGLDAAGELLRDVLNGERVQGIEVSQKAGYLHSATIKLANPLKLVSYEEDSVANYKALVAEQEGIVTRVCAAFGMSPLGTRDSEVKAQHSRGYVTSIQIYGEENVRNFVTSLQSRTEGSGTRES